ncbi:MAG TPA: hypothetical protein EYG03_13450 [Planctomycetes bacterium]|nr:hypothetical protein [Fuerstiella sp.]HIK92967.1 hypothetical protein [Planctomycetota bacterium]
MSIASSTNTTQHHFIVKHLHFGWWSLLSFVVLGITLEAMHAFKVGWYLEEAYTTRRLMWTLGHAHGTLLSLVHIAFATTLSLLPHGLATSRRIASGCLMGGTILLPGGFFLGGIFIYDGDPGIGVWLVPVGALLLLIAVFLTALGTLRASRAGSDVSDGNG